MAGPGLGFLALFPLAALAHAAAAPAGEPIPIHVEFDAPAGCSSVDAFYAGVMARSDRARRAGATEEGVHLGVRLTRAAGKVHGELRVLDGRGDLETRKVDGGRCDEVVEVLSLTAALAIDPTARVSSVPLPAASVPATPAAPTPPPPVGASPVPAPPPRPAAESPAAPPPERPSAPAPAAETARAAAAASPSTVALRVGVGALGGETVSASLGGAISVRLERRVETGRGPSLGLAGLYLSNELLAPAAELAARFTAIEITGCPGWSLGATIAVEPCAQAVGGWLTATDHAVSNPRSVGRTWGSLGALARASLRLGAGFALELEAGIAVPLVERRFMTNTPERNVGQTPAIAGTLRLGITWAP